jgi:hypothetical protein
MTKNLWMDLWAGPNELVLQEYHQAYAAFAHFPEPDVQRPQMITLIGSKDKNSAVQNLCFSNQVRLKSSDNNNGNIYLSVDADTTQASSPVLYANCELHTNSSFNWISARQALGSVVHKPLLWRKKCPSLLIPSTSPI